MVCQSFLINKSIKKYTELIFTYTDSVETKAKYLEAKKAGNKAKQGIDNPLDEYDLEARIIKMETKDIERDIRKRGGRARREKIIARW